MKKTYGWLLIGITASAVSVFAITAETSKGPRLSVGTPANEIVVTGEKTGACPMMKSRTVTRVYDADTKGHAQVARSGTELASTKCSFHLQKKAESKETKTAMTCNHGGASCHQ